jgi:hypothetical protein
MGHPLGCQCRRDQSLGHPPTEIKSLGHAPKFYRLPTASNIPTQAKNGLEWATRPVKCALVRIIFLKLRRVLMAFPDLAFSD